MTAAADARKRLSVGNWPRHLAALAGLAAAIMLLFARDVGDMVAIWWTSSSYGHCLFIPLLIGWLVQQRIDGLKRLKPNGWAGGLAWLAGGALLWLVGDTAGLAVLRHGGLIVMLQGAVASCLGSAVTRALMFPLFYAFFMVPVGSELEPALQLLTARMATALLGFAGVPAHIEGIFITIPNGRFEVAEACSGAKFLIAMAAFAVLACHLCFRSWTRRTIFLLSALGATILANILRAFATIYVAHRTNVDAAIGFDHVFYGWLFFALVMAAVMLTAWPFFDRKPDDPVFDVEIMRRVEAKPRPLPVLCVTALAIVATPFLWSHLSAARGGETLARPMLPEIPGWRHTAQPMRSAWNPRFDGADHLVRTRYADAEGLVVDLVVVVYARQSEGRELIGFGQGAAGPDSGWVWSSPAWTPANARGEAIAADRVVRHVVSFYRVGMSALTGSAAEVKFDTMKARLFGGDQRAVAILISAEDRDVARAERTIRRFLSAVGDPEELADAALRSR